MPRPMRRALVVRLSKLGLVLGFSLGLGQTPLRANPAPPGAPPPTIQIDPNAIQTMAEPMRIDLKGISGQQVYFFILKDCDRHQTTADLNEYCQPVYHWSDTLGPDGRLHKPLDLAQLARELKKNGKSLPTNVNLWLRVSSDPSGQRAYQDAIFAVAHNPCSLWASFIELFRTGRCRVGLPDLITRYRTDAAVPVGRLEIKRVPIRAGKVAGGPQAVANTLGATGVAWLDTKALLVTIRKQDDPVNEQQNALDSGLYRINLTDGSKRRLVAAGALETLMAPYALPDGRIVFVRRLDEAPADGAKTRLLVWRDGRIVQDIPLRRSIHQILATDDTSRWVLAYSLWNRVPEFVQIDLVQGTVTELGMSAQLYHAAMHAPKDPVSAVAMVDPTGFGGWDLMLVNDQGTLADEVSVGRGHDLWPAWRPDGAELVFVGQWGSREGSR